MSPDGRVVAGPVPGLAGLWVASRFGSLPEDALVTQGLWRYAHYYDPVSSAPTMA